MQRLNGEKLLLMKGQKYYIELQTYCKRRIVDLSDILIREIAKDRKSAESEINRTADFIRFTADTSKSIYGESIVK